MNKIISRQELLDMISKGVQFKLVDVLTRDSYRRQHIRGSISLPLDEIEEKAQKLLGEDEKIVVYCASSQCEASAMAASKLLSMGYKDVSEYKGGLKDYKEANLPLDKAKDKDKKHTCSF